MNEGLRILVVHPSPPIARSILRDIRRIGLHTTLERKVASADEARQLIPTMLPHIVFLGLDLPNAGAIKLLGEYSPAYRDFAVILVDAGTHAPQERQRHLHLLLQRHLAGYLIVGDFDNTVLGQSIENAFHHLQQRLLNERQHEIIDFLLHTALAEVQLRDAPPTTPTTMLPPPQQKPRLPEARIALLLPPITDHPATENPTDEHGTLLPWQQVIRIQMRENYYEIVFLADEDSFRSTLLRKQMLNTDLLPSTFTKVHRSHIVNLRHVLTIQRDRIQMRCGTSIKLPKNQQARIHHLLQQFSHHVRTLDTLRAFVQKKSQ